MKPILAIGAIALVAGGAYLLLRPGAPDLTPSAQDIARAEELRPQDPEINAIYARSCISCHAIVGSGAPLVGHKVAWDVRLKERGLAGLLHSAREGFGAMPAMGLCNDCTPDQFTALITFMSSGDSQ